MWDRDDSGRWASHLEQCILPWWDTHGLDKNDRGVFTCFDNDGRLVSQEKYSWSQGRWAWLSAEIALDARNGILHTDHKAWERRCIETSRFLAENVILPGGFTAYRTDVQGRHLQDDKGRVSTSIFADLFVALGLSAGARLVDDTSLADEWFDAAKTIVIESQARAVRRVALTEPYPVPQGFLDLAEPMNLLHTAAELLRIHDDVQLRGVRDRALAELIGEDGRIATEFWWEFKPINEDLADTMLACHRTPGHLLEALWMIEHAINQARSRGENITEFSCQRALSLAKTALKMGWDEISGGILRYSDIRGGCPQGRLVSTRIQPYEQLVSDTWSTKLWWVHCEAMYTAHMLTRRSSEMLHWAKQVEMWTMTVFPDYRRGEWLQIRNRNGSPLNDVVALPVKDPFHIIRSLIFLNRLEKGLAPYGDDN